MDYIIEKDGLQKIHQMSRSNLRIETDVVGMFLKHIRTKFDTTLILDKLLALTRISEPIAFSVLSRLTVCLHH